LQATVSSSGTSALVPNLDEDLANCYQCGKCTAGCPVSAHMDLVPSQVMRLMQLGQSERALHSQAIWQCVSCQTCTARCPKQVDCAGVMDFLREKALAEDSIAPEQQPVVVFQKAFLDNVRRNGRVNELELTMRFKAGVFLRTRQAGWLFKDAGLAPQLRKRERIHLTSEKAQDRALVERIFARCSSSSL